MVSQAQLNKALQKKNSAGLIVAQLEGTISNHSTTPLNKFSVKKYNETLKELYDEIRESYQTIFEGCDPSEKTTHETESAELVEKVLQAQIALMEIEEKLNPGASHNQQNASSSTSVTMRLPKLNIEKFSGDILEWRSFKDLFEAAVDRSTISAAQKLQHLKSLLSSEPLQSIQGISITDANYHIAWKILCDRYDDNKLLKASYIETLLYQPSVKEESSVALRKLLDTTAQCERNLEALGCPTDQWGDLILHVMSRNLDSETRKLWDIYIADKSTITVDLMVKFVGQRCQSLESRRDMKKSEKVPTPQNSGKKQAASHVATTSKCELCCQDHFIWMCETFVSASPCERSTLVKQHNLCYNCLRSGHMASKCRSRNCGRCGKRHNTLLHEDKSSEASENTVHDEEKTEGPSSDQAQASSHHAGCKPTDTSKVVLATASILVKDRQGKFQECRALLDPGSQATFMSQACVKRLRVKLSPTYLQVTGVNGGESFVTHSCATINIGSRLDDEFSASAVVYVLPHVSTLMPTVPLNTSKFSSFDKLEPADSNFHTPGDIDILIGADLFYDFLREGFIRTQLGGPIAQNTVFGWVIAGPSSDIDLPTITTECEGGCGKAKCPALQATTRFQK